MGKVSTTRILKCENCKSKTQHRLVRLVFACETCKSEKTIKNIETAFPDDEIQVNGKLVKVREFEAAFEEQLKDDQKDLKMQKREFKKGFAQRAIQRLNST